MKTITEKKIKLTSAEGKQAKAKWNSMTLKERYNWLKDHYNFSKIDAHGMSTLSINQLGVHLKKSLVTGNLYYSA